MLQKQGCVHGGQPQQVSTANDNKDHEERLLCSSVPRSIEVLHCLGISTIHKTLVPLECPKATVVWEVREIPTGGV